MGMVQFVCWLVVAYAFFGKWSDTHYLANSLIFIACITLLFLSYK
jgi:hypothetical protein